MKILIAIDQSACSETAISAVLDRSWPTGTTFEVLPVIEPLVSQFALADARSLRAMVEANRGITDYTQKLVDEKVFELAAIFGKTRVEGSVMEGPIAETIVEKAHSIDN